MTYGDAEVGGIWILYFRMDALDSHIAGYIIFASSVFSYASEKMREREASCCNYIVTAMQERAATQRMSQFDEKCPVRKFIL